MEFKNANPETKRTPMAAEWQQDPNLRIPKSAATIRRS